MTSSRPYLLRAIYEWLLDNQLTPYVMVDATVTAVDVPRHFVEDGKIVLNIEPQAIAALRMGNDAVEFDARFTGKAYHVYLPIRAVKAIYAYENGRGMVFNDEDDDDDGGGSKKVPMQDAPPQDTARKGPPHLKVVK